MKVLLIEARETMVVELVKRLTSHHVVVDVVASTEEGWSYGSTFGYDLIVIDEQPPTIQAIELCRRFRDEGFTLPILLLLSADSSTSLVEALDAGADDGMISPLNLDELHARIRSLLRRGRANPFPVLVWGDLMLNSSTCEVTYRDQPILLTAKEYALLELFLRDTQHVFSIEEILESLWSSEEFPSEATVRSHLRRLRHKLSLAGAAPDFIATVHGRGYYIKAIEHGVSSNENAADGAQRRTEEHQLQSHHSDSTVPYLVSSLKTASLAASEPSMTAVHPSVSPPADGDRNAVSTSYAQLPDLPLSPEAPVVLILSDEPAAADILGQAALAQGLWVAIAPDLEQAKLWLVPNSVRPRPAAILIQIMSHIATPGETQLKSHQTQISDRLKRTLDTLRLLSSHDLSVPTAVISGELSWNDRLIAARSGCSLLLSDMAEPDRAIAALMPLIKIDTRHTKVLAIDSDAAWLQAMLTLLTPWGFEVITLDDAEPVIAILESINPTVIVLEVNLTEWSGLDLCRLLRSTPQWRHVPILFLSEATDPTIQAQAMAAGADDYMIKPMQGKDLAERIVARLRRLHMRAG